MTSFILVFSGMGSVNIKTAGLGDVIAVAIVLIIATLAVAVPISVAQEKRRNELDRKLDQDVLAALKSSARPVFERRFADLLPKDDVLYFEIDKVGFYELRRSRSVGYAHASLTGRSGPARLRIGAIGFANPEVFSKIDDGRILVTSKRIIFQGSVRRHEWLWARVGDIRYDREGLLLWPRNGRPKGLRLSEPNAKLFAYIERSIEA